LKVAATNEGLELFGLIANASLIVQLVMLMLLVASVISWTMIFRKWFALKAAHRAADRFESRFWSGGNLAAMAQELSRPGTSVTGMDSLFVAGYREYTRLTRQAGLSPDAAINGVQRAMRVALAREIEHLERYLSFLATVGSTSPYVGLFGTVWGIMNSFRSLGAVQQATIAHVAPGIAEALIATAMGLFAAIPAVIAYNRYAHDVEKLVNRYEAFMEEFASIVQRQALSPKEHGLAAV
jgi:biopolymer transport protein TolQ